MAYTFVNQNTGKATITDESETKLTLAGINTQGNDANEFMTGLTIMLDIVNWRINDAVRIVNQDVYDDKGE